MSLSTESLRVPLSARPSLTLVLLVSPGTDGIEGIVGEVLPSCREYGVDLLVAGGPPGLRLNWEGESVRSVTAGPGESEVELRARVMTETGADIVLFVPATGVGALDLGALLGHRSGIVSGDLLPANDGTMPAGRSVG